MNTSLKIIKESIDGCDLDGYTIKELQSAYELMDCPEGLGELEYSMTCDCFQNIEDTIIYLTEEK